GKEPPVAAAPLAGKGLPIGREATHNQAISQTGASHQQQGASQMNPIVLAPTSLASTPPLEYIDAAVQAGYDGIGIRLFRSPGINYAFYPVAGDAELTKQ